MLCIVCSRLIPIPIYRDENKLCNSCASQVKLKKKFMNDICTDADLEIVQRQLLNDLNLENDSDYEAELNYLKEAKKAQILSKETNVHTENLKEFPYSQYEKLKPETETLVRECLLESKNVVQECVPELKNQVKKKIENAHGSFSSFKFGNQQSTKSDPKLPQLLTQQKKEKVNRRVVINRAVSISIVSVKKPDETPNQSDGTLTIACRAVFHPTPKQKEPCPQFEKIHSIEKIENLTKRREMLPMTGNKNPFICPVTFCKNIIPVSDLIKHFKLNHIRVPIVPVVSDACTNFFWETKVDRFGVSQCLMLLLFSTGKKEFVYEQFRDCLPVAVMTTKVKLSDLTDVDSEQEDGRHFYMIWLTEMSSSVQPVHYTITAWSGQDDGRVHIVNTSQSYSIRSDQNPKIIYGSGMVMILTPEQINRLSNNNRDMVKLQVVVH